MECRTAGVTAALYSSFWMGKPRARAEMGGSEVGGCRGGGYAAGVVLRWVGCTGG